MDTIEKLIQRVLRTQHGFTGIKRTADESVGYALRDISRKHKVLVKAELQKWDVSNKSIEQTYKLAGKFL